MPSAVFWIELSARERRDNDGWLRSLKNEETVDSLGLAPLLEALSNKLYPGTVTGMTRARYYLLIPHLYRYVAHHPGRDAFEQAIALQVALSRAIGPEPGNIGVRSGKDLSRFPASIYWGRLRALGLLKEEISEQEYLSSAADAARRNLVDDDGAEHGSLGVDGCWQADIPCRFEVRAGRIKTGGTLELDRVEREYLRRLFQERFPGSLIAYCIGRRLRVGQTGPWEQLAGIDSPSLRDEVRLARRFRAAQRGMSLLYARCVAVTRRDDADTVAAIDAELDGWLGRQRKVIERFDPDRLLDHLESRPQADTRAFLRDFRIECIRSGSAKQLAARMQDLIESREASVRPTKQRLGLNVRRDLLRQWSFDPGDGVLYEGSTRHQVARRIVEDLVRGGR